MAFQYAPIGPGKSEGIKSLIADTKLQAAPTSFLPKPPAQTRDRDEAGFEGLARGLVAAPLARLLLDQGVSRIPFLRDRIYEDPITGQPVSRDERQKEPPASVFTEDSLEGLPSPQREALLQAEKRVRQVYPDQVKRPRELTRTGETIEGILQLLSSIGLKGDDVSTFTSSLGTSSKIAAGKDEANLRNYLTQQKNISDKILSSMPGFSETNVFGAYRPISSEQREEADKTIQKGKRPKFSDSRDPYQIDRQALVNDKTGEVHLISLGTDADRDENNELVEAGKFYKNLNFTATAKRGEREKPSEILLQNQLNPRDVRQGLWEYYDKNGDGTPEPVFKVEEAQTDGSIKYIALDELSRDPGLNNYLPDGRSAWLQMDGEVFEKQPRPKQKVVTGINDYLDDVNARDAAMKRMLAITNQLESLDPAAYARTTATIANFANNIKSEVKNFTRFFGGTGKKGFEELKDFNARGLSSDATAAQALSVANLEFLNDPTQANKDRMIKALVAFKNVAKQQRPSQGLFDSDSWLFSDNFESDKLKDLSVDRAVLLSSQIQLGYLSATLFGQSGKNLSDADFAYNLQLMGFEKSDDKDVILNNLNNYLAKELYMMDQDVAAQPYLSGSANEKDIAVSALFSGTLGVSPSDLEVISRPRPVGENNEPLADRDPAVLAWADNNRKAQIRIRTQLNNYVGGKGIGRIFRYDPNARGSGVGGYRMSNAQERLGKGDSGYNIIDNFTAPGGIFDRRGKRIFGSDWDWRIQGGASQNEDRLILNPTDNVYQITPDSVF